MSESSTLQIEQPVDLRRVIRLIARRRKWVSGLAGLGLVAGLGYGAIQSSQPTATALVQLPPATTDSTGTVTRDMATEALVATSPGVLSTALKSHPVQRQLTVGELRHTVHADAVTQDILAVKVTDSSGEEAVRLANAVASAYTNRYNQPQSTPAGQAVAEVQKDGGNLAALVASLQKLVAETSSSSADKSALLAAIRDELTQVSSAIDALANSTATVDVNASGAATVIQPALSASGPPATRFISPVGIGTAAGLLIGAIVAFSLGRRDRRLRRRSEIEAALGLPVLATVTAEDCRTPTDWENILRRSNSSPVTAWNLHRLLAVARTVGHESRGIDLIAFAGDGPALAVGPQLAAHCASTGVSTSLVTNSVPGLQDLRAAAAAGWNGPLRIESEDIDHGAEFQVGVRVVDTESIETTSLQTPRPVLVAVSAGAVTADDLARLALLIDDRGGEMVGLVVANPEPGDEYLGAGTSATLATAGASAAERVEADTVGPIEPSAEDVTAERERTP